MVSLALVAELESLRFAATLGSTSQRLNLQVGQVVNRARDILRYNGSTFSRNASTSFWAESTLHGSFLKIPRLAGASRHRNVLPKEVCKTCSCTHGKNSVFKWKPLDPWWDNLFGLSRFPLRWRWTTTFFGKEQNQRLHPNPPGFFSSSATIAPAAEHLRKAIFFY